MGFESTYLSKGGYSEIDRISRFIQSLVIKNNIEADEKELAYMTESFYEYSRVYEEPNLTPVTIPYTYDDLIDYGFTAGDIMDMDLMNHVSMITLIQNGVSKIVSFMQKQRSKILGSYVEQNEYYRSFLGLPPTTADYVYVNNLDKPGETIPIHLVDKVSYPITYEYYFIISTNLSDLISKNPDKQYLRFLTDSSKLDVYYIRKAPNFTILTYDTGILTDAELERFIHSYNQSRLYVLDILYISGYHNTYPLYNGLMLLVLLSLAFNKYFNYKLDDYRLKRYTIDDIYSILDSNGLSSLKTITDTSILERVVKNLDVLNEYKGSEYILNLLFDIIGDSNTIIKKYDIIKEYRVDSKGDLEYDISKMYEDNVTIKFKERQISNGIQTSVDNLKVIDYDEMTNSDDMWGNIHSSMDSNTKTLIRESLKRELLQMEFNKIPSKYMTISKTLNTQEVSAEASDVFYIVLKYLYTKHGQGPDNDLYHMYTKVENIQVEPILIYAAGLIFLNIANSNDEPGLIQRDILNMAAITNFKYEGIADIVQELGDGVVEIPNNTYNSKLKDILSEYDIIDLVAKYNIDVTNSLSDVFIQYRDNLEIIKLIKNKLINSSGCAEYKAWKTLYDYNVTDVDLSFLFEGHTSYLDFIKSKNTYFYNYIMGKITEMDQYEDDKVRRVKAGSYSSEMIIKFAVFITEYIDREYIIPANEGSDDSDFLINFKTLLMEYASLFVELFSIDYTIDVTDEPFNAIQVLYQQTLDISKGVNYDNISTIYKTLLIRDSESHEFNIIDIDYILNAVDKYDGEFNVGGLFYNQDFNIDKFNSFYNINTNYKKIIDRIRYSDSYISELMFAHNTISRLVMNTECELNTAYTLNDSKIISRHSGSLGELQYIMELK